MHEQCGVAAVIDLEGKRDVVPIAAAIARGLQHRGELGAGMAWCDERGRIRALKGGGLAQNVLSDENIAAAGAHGSVAIAHTRYATSGGTDPCMYQPYVYGNKESGEEFAFAFNGNIANCPEQKERLIKEGHPPSIEGDTEIIGRTIIAAMQGDARADMLEVLRDLDRLDGAFNIVMLQENGSLAALRDKHGFHPLTYARHESLLMVASEDRAIKKVIGEAETIDVSPGSLIRAYPGESELHKDSLWLPERRTCFFESVYFADHGSRIDNRSVRNVRYACGRMLGEMDRDRPQTDIVIPVPASAKTAASGYADTRIVSRVDAILKNPDVGRTFISPSERSRKAEIKYVIRPLLIPDGQAAILMEDSLVRATTMRALVKRLRSETRIGEIHLRIASPPIVSPCFYGIDISTVEELFVRKYSSGVLDENGFLPDDVLAAMAKDLGVDSIKFLSRDAIPLALRKSCHDLCMACVTKSYPTPEGVRLAALAEESAAVE